MARYRFCQRFARRNGRLLRVASAHTSRLDANGTILLYGRHCVFWFKRGWSDKKCAAYFASFFLYSHAYAPIYCKFLLLFFI